MKRLRAIIAEIWDDETGQVAHAELLPEGRWPPPLVAVAGFRDLEEARGPVTAQDDEATQETSQEPSRAETSPVEGEEQPTTPMASQAASQAPESAGAESVPPGPPPAPEPVIAEDRAPAVEAPDLGDRELPAFEIDDSASSLKSLVWDSGVTERGRKLYTAPFDGGMWLVMDNDGEFPVLYRRFGEAQPHGAPRELAEAKKIATATSWKWMRDDAGDDVLNSLARAIATEWLAAVGTWVEIKGRRYHFRKGRVRRQLTTLVLCYVATTHEKKHPRVEFRISWTVVRDGVYGQQVRVWAMHYNENQTADGAMIEKDIDRGDFEQFRYLVFGPALGKRLDWKRTEDGTERYQYGPYTLELRTSKRGITGLYLKEKGEDDQLVDCGTDVAQLKARALNKALRNLRRKSRMRRERVKREKKPVTPRKKPETPRKPPKPTKKPAPSKPASSKPPPMPGMPGTPPVETPADESKKSPSKKEPGELAIKDIKLGKKTEETLRALAKIGDANDARYEEILADTHGNILNTLYDNGLLRDARVDPAGKSAITRRGSEYLRYKGIVVEDSEGAGEDKLSESELKAISGDVGDYVDKALAKFQRPSGM